MKFKNLSSLPHGLGLAAVTTAVFGLYIFLASQNHFSEIEPLMDGTAARPYIYRVLPFFLARLAAGATGASYYAAALLVMYASLLGFAFSMRALARVFLPARFAGAAALFAPIGLIPFLIEQRHVYDFPILFLFTLSLYFLAVGKFAAYLPAFAAATLTKETSLFLILFFVIQFRNLERKKLALRTALQLAVYFAIRLAVIVAYRNNPGAIAEIHFEEHIAAYRWNSIGLAWLVIAIAVIVAAAFAARKRSNFPANSLLAVGGPTLILYLFFGVPFEIRIFMESYPSILLSLALALLPP